MKKLILLPILFITAITFAQLPSYVPTNSLETWHPFNGNVNDESINNNVATVNGATLSNDRFGENNRAYFFDGVNNSGINITTPNKIISNSNKEFTLELWVKPNRTIQLVGESNVCPGGVSVPMANSNQNWAINPQVNGGVAGGLGVGVSIGTNGLTVGEHAGNVLVGRLSHSTPLSGFNHVVVVYRVDSSFLYLNNQLVRSRAMHCTSNSKVLTTTLGYSLYSPPFSGVIDHFSAWSRALSPNEINKLYNSGGIAVKAFNDINNNCILDNTEFGVQGVVAIVSPGNDIGYTNSSGIIYFDSLSDGNYNIQFDNTNLRWSTNCSNTLSFNIVSGIPDTNLDFGMISNFPCAEPNVSVAAPTLRRCFSNQKVYVSACNDYTATGVLSNAYVDVKLPSLLTKTGATLADSALGNNTFRFQLGDVNPGQCVNFTINTTVSCSASLNQTLCVEANLYPADSCIFDTVPAVVTGVSPCTLPWDKSSLSVEGWCNNDTVYFTVENTGDLGGGDMDCFSPVRVYTDGEIVQMDSIKLLGGEIDTFMFAGGGLTWRLEADQHPLHPGFSEPNATVELCGDSTQWTPNLVTVLPQDDADPIVDIFCGVVSGSYDPNDKTGYPLGVTDTHFVYPNGKMEYLIRFQNTGNDTAFTVVIRDTLDTDLDIFSVVSGVSSHDYTFRMYGPRVLEWRFDNIMLPDSTVDLEGSNGFVKFEVFQNPNLANGTKILNSAAIYFDFNAPIITNETEHTIDDGIKSLMVVDTTINGISNLNNKSLLIYPNPSNGQFIVKFNKKVNNATINIHDMNGRKIHSLNNVSGYQTSMDVNLPKGIYVVSTNTGGEITRQKLVIK